MALFFVKSTAGVVVPHYVENGPVISSLASVSIDGANHEMFRARDESLDGKSCAVNHQL